MPRLRLLVIATSIAMAACSQSSNDNQSTSAPAPATSAPAAGSSTAQANAANPFFTASTLPFQAPPFDKIKEGDYQPGIEEGMRQHLAEIEKIADSAEPPTFDNTFIPMEKSGALLKRAMMAFDTVTGANTSDALQKVQE